MSKLLRGAQETLAAILSPLALRRGARFGLRLGACKEPGLTANLIAVARAACRLMMAAPGVGALTGLSYVSMIEDPANFANARGAYIGLAARSYQSGEMDDDGRISKRGGKRVRAVRFDVAASLVLTRIRSESAARVSAA